MNDSPNCDFNKVQVTKQKLVEIMLESLSAERLSEIVMNVADLVHKKNQDYGDAWQVYGCFTALVRINDKTLRLKNLSDGKVALVAESVEDNLIDILGYAALALLWIKENSGD